MKRSKRSCYQRLDYRALHSSGRKIPVSSSSESESESENDSQDFNNNPTEQAIDPLLISQFEELSCRSTSDVIESANESVCESTSQISDHDSVFTSSATVVASQSSSASISESEVLHSSSASVGNLPQILIQSYQSLLTENNSSNEALVSQCIPSSNDTTVSKELANEWFLEISRT